MKIAVALCALALAAGIVLETTTHDVLGIVLIVGAVGGLGGAALPAAIMRVATFLSAGRR